MRYALAILSAAFFGVSLYFGYREWMGMALYAALIAVAFVPVIGNSQK